MSGENSKWQSPLLKTDSKYTHTHTHIRAVRYDDIYRMDEIKSLSFHIMFYRLYRAVAKYIVYVR